MHAPLSSNVSGPLRKIEISLVAVSRGRRRAAAGASAAAGLFSLSQSVSQSVCRSDAARTHVCICAFRVASRDPGCLCIIGRARRLCGQRVSIGNWSSVNRSVGRSVDREFDPH